jgi:hypothetical protein
MKATLLVSQSMKATLLARYKQTKEKNPWARKSPLKTKGNLFFLGDISLNGSISGAKNPTGILFLPFENIVICRNLVYGSIYHYT